MLQRDVANPDDVRRRAQDSTLYFFLSSSLNFLTISSCASKDDFILDSVAAMIIFARRVFLFLSTRCSWRLVDGCQSALTTPRDVANPDEGVRRAHF
ncbi:hypothetical protein B0H10DRAFT_2069728 [Mycena sp. CBHHK59/15]|nr:hypothetical protein B0H10DRAFT_2069728 [Mycena sp. CBHHK59/15]